MSNSGQYVEAPWSAAIRKAPDVYEVRIIYQRFQQQTSQGKVWRERIVSQEIFDPSTGQRLYPASPLPFSAA